MNVYLSIPLTPWLIPITLTIGLFFWAATRPEIPHSGYFPDVTPIVRFVLVTMTAMALWIIWLVAYVIWTQHP